jgi:hypothetical protein
MPSPNYGGLNNVRFQKVNFMNANKNTIIRIASLVLLLIAATFLFSSCEEEDPFVDRTVSPVLMVFDGISGYLANGGLTMTPTRTYTVTADNYQTPGDWAVAFYELDKSGILDNSVGIDSIPVTNLAVKFTKLDGTLIADLMTDANGIITATLDWTTLVPDVATIVASEAAYSIDIPVSWTGEYKGLSFTRYSVVKFSKPKS